MVHISSFYWSSKIQFLTREKADKKTFCFQFHFRQLGGSRDPQLTFIFQEQVGWGALLLGGDGMIRHDRRKRFSTSKVGVYRIQSQQIAFAQSP